MCCCPWWLTRQDQTSTRLFCALAEISSYCDKGSPPQKMFLNEFFLKVVKTYLAIHIIFSFRFWSKTPKKNFIFLDDFPNGGSLQNVVRVKIFCVIAIFLVIGNFDVTTIIINSNIVLVIKMPNIRPKVVLPLIILCEWGYVAEGRSHCITCSIWNQPVFKLWFHFQRSFENLIWSQFLGQVGWAGDLLRKLRQLFWLLTRLDLLGDNVIT